MPCRKTSLWSCICDREHGNGTHTACIRNFFLQTTKQFQNTSLGSVTASRADMEHLWIDHIAYLHLLFAETWGPNHIVPRGRGRGKCNNCSTATIRDEQGGVTILRSTRSTRSHPCPARPVGQFGDQTQQRDKAFPTSSTGAGWHQTWRQIPSMCCACATRRIQRSSSLQPEVTSWFGLVRVRHCWYIKNHQKSSMMFQGKDVHFHIFKSQPKTKQKFQGGPL